MTCAAPDLAAALAAALASVCPAPAITPPAAVTVAPAPVAEASAEMWVGVNMAEYLNPGSMQIPWKNVAMQMAAWEIQPKPSNTQTPHADKSIIDANGNVTALSADNRAVSSIWKCGSGKYPAGVYTVLYDGEGSISWWPIPVLSSTPGRTTLQITPQSGCQGGISFSIEWTNPANPLRNIRIILPGYENTYASDPWNPAFLAVLAPFNTIRFMGWSATNFDTTKEWADRRPVTYVTQASPPNFAAIPAIKGVAWEYVIDLANRLNVNPWVNVPMAASDDYIAQMAKLFHTKLKPVLKPMVEYSNEVWNPTFWYTQCTMRAEAARLKLTTTVGPLCPVGPDGRFAGSVDSSQGDGQYAYYAYRLAHIFDIWDAEYGDRSKIVHIVAQQQRTDWEVEKIMNYGAPYGLAKKADVLATGGYVSAVWGLDNLVNTGQKTWAQVVAMTPADVLALMNGDLTYNLVEAGHPGFPATAVEAAKWGLKSVVYEGGEANYALDAPQEYQMQLLDLLARTARDPGMGTLYARMLDAAKAAGFVGFNQFYDVGEYNQYGLWGLLESQAQDPLTSPKWVAMRNWIAAHAPR